MNFEQEFRNHFGERFSNLYLKSVVVSESDNLCTITFLYPSKDENLTEEEKEEIVEFISNLLKFEQLKLKVKFLKAYVEEKLIRKSISQFFEDKFKLLNTYIHDEDVELQISNIDVLMNIKASPRIAEFFISNKVSSQLSAFLKDNYLVEFNINLEICENKVEEVDIESVPLKTSARRVQRYSVQIIKEVVGKDIPPSPEYISYITSPKNAVIVAGYISNLARRDFTIKKGARAGLQKAYFTFNICDGKGKLDCIFFCPKRYEKDLEALEENMFLLLHGDVKFGLNANKLVLYVDKIALASEEEGETLLDDEKEEENFKEVEIERLNATEQDSMFGRVVKYNQKIMTHTFVVFDLETTGLNTDLDQIIELGAVKIENGNIVEKFSTFVKPTTEIPYEVTRLTHITNEMVEDAPPVEAVIAKFYEFTRGCVLSGHNVINFDIKFIKRFGQIQNLIFDNDVIDTINEARVSRLKISRFNLGTVTKALGIELKDAHRAWNDAFATAQVLLKLNELGK